MATARWNVSCTATLHEFGKLTVPSCSLGWLRPVPGVPIAKNSNRAMKNARVFMETPRSMGGPSTKDGPSTNGSLTDTASVDGFYLGSATAAYGLWPMVSRRNWPLPGPAPTSREKLPHRSGEAHQAETIHHLLC